MLSADERFDQKYVADTNGCWLWTRSLSVKGYATFAANGKTVRAHKYSYERSKGPVPVGLEIDHLCRVRHCVNPDHLEAVTHTENVRRRVIETFTTTGMCRAGHADTPANRSINRAGDITCRTCKLAAQKANRDRNPMTNCPRCGNFMKQRSLWKHNRDFHAGEGNGN